MKNISILLLGYCAFLLFNSFNIQINGWLAPEIASKKINPVASNEKSLKLGKKYTTKCVGRATVAMVQEMVQQEYL